jgi:2'-5' RNA ligase
VPVELPVPLRRLRDGLARVPGLGVPPHVTLLYPFMAPAALTDDIRRRVAAIVAAEQAFSFTLRQVRRWPGVVWLAPEPDAPFRSLIASLRAEFPDFPPYGGAYAEVVPHVTIVEDERPDWLEAAERALPAMLPVRDVAREAQVIATREDGKWAVVWRLPLGRRG